MAYYSWSREQNCHCGPLLSEENSPTVPLCGPFEGTIRCCFRWIICDRFAFGGIAATEYAIFAYPAFISSWWVAYIDQRGCRSPCGTDPWWSASSNYRRDQWHTHCQPTCPIFQVSSFGLLSLLSQAMISLIFVTSFHSCSLELSFFSKKTGTVGPHELWNSFMHCLCQSAAALATRHHIVSTSHVVPLTSHHCVGM